MTSSTPWILRLWADRPAVWGLIAAGSLVATVLSLWFGFGFAFVIFLLGTVVTAVRTRQILRPKAVEGTGGSGGRTVSDGE